MKLHERYIRWIDAEESRQVINDKEKMSEIADEMADVLSYLLVLSSALKIDLSKAFLAKMKKNEQKYPVETYRGRYKAGLS